MSQPNCQSSCMRDSNGRFVPRDTAGQNTSMEQRAAALRMAFAKAISEEELGALVRLLYAKALEGDDVAARIVCSYMICNRSQKKDRG